MIYPIIKQQKNVVTQFELSFGSCDIGILSTGIKHWQGTHTQMSG